MLRKESFAAQRILATRAAVITGISTTLTTLSDEFVFMVEMAGEFR
jgi:hypothetical protein